MVSTDVLDRGTQAELRGASLAVEEAWGILWRGEETAGRGRACAACEGCPHCKERIKPMIADALPGAMVSHRTLVLSAWLHYDLGNRFSPMVEVFTQRHATTERGMHARKRHDCIDSR